MGQTYSLTSDEAQRLIAVAIETLKVQSKTASISIVNRDRTEIAMAIMDGVKPFTQKVAFLKAQQSAWTGKSTSSTRNEIEAGMITAEIIGIDSGRIVPWAGGMPIYDEAGYLIGGIGISNLSQGEDEKVAEDVVIKAGFKVHAE